MKERLVEFFGKIVVTFVIQFLLVSLVFMYTWNWIVPDVFGLDDFTINYVESIGVMILANILFKPVQTTNK